MKSVISHSEVDQFLACERKHYYAFGKPILNSDGTTSNGLEPVRISDGLFRGNVGHEVLETYYGYLSNLPPDTPISEFNFAMARTTALDLLTSKMTEYPDKLEMFMGLQIVLNAYFGYYQEEDSHYQYLAIETEFRTVVNDEIDFPFKPDMIRRHRSTGRVEVVDHKFLANLYKSDEIAIQPQMAKYVGSLRALGYQVDDATYDLICHRVLKTKSYDPTVSLRRTALNLTDKRIDRSMFEQNSVVKSIAEYKTMFPEKWELRVRRTATAYNCKNCPFLQMCIADLNGEDTSVMVKFEYRPNSYGYDKVKVGESSES